MVTALEISLQPQLTTWYYVFNYLNSLSFTKEELINEITRLSKELSWHWHLKTLLKEILMCLLEVTHCQKIREIILMRTI